MHCMWQVQWPTPRASACRSSSLECARPSRQILSSNLDLAKKSVNISTTDYLLADGRCEPQKNDAVGRLYVYAYSVVHSVRIWHFMYLSPCSTKRKQDEKKKKKIEKMKKLAKKKVKDVEK